MFLQNVARLAPAARHLSTSAVVKSAPKLEVAEGFKSLKDVQAQYQVWFLYIHPIIFKLKLHLNNFQKHDGKPIFLKRGTSDQILYRLTMAGCIVGMAGIGQLIYQLA